jgi:hypothetical protein
MTFDFRVAVLGLILACDKNDADKDLSSDSALYYFLATLIPQNLDKILIIILI